MTPDDFLKELVKTADVDQMQAASRTMATMCGVFYAGLVADDLDEEIALEMALELIRCMVGDHKPV